MDPPSRRGYIEALDVGERLRCGFDRRGFDPCTDCRKIAVSSNPDIPVQPNRSRKQDTDIHRYIAEEFH
ncbi:MAG TPA: hypothetical protein VGR47_05265 [Terracidiphilus sp.]|nr:hypothetical protein [Terracidiphilus sp.]